MKIDTTDIGVFSGAMSLDEANAWLLGDDGNLSLEANGAIDEATSFAADNGRAFVLIEIKKGGQS